MTIRLNDEQKKNCHQVVNVFESGKVEGDYGALVTLGDGPHGTRQVTYGRSQTTEYGNLEELVRMYVNANGSFSQQLHPYIEKIGVVPLADDEQFKQLLQTAGRNDPVMRRIQDEFFDKRYFNPAMQWADDNGFTLPLSALVIYDSFIHSGGILAFLRKRFPELPPAKGGNEKDWINQYVDVRHEFLKNNPNEIVRRTIYRTQCFKNEIARANWDLLQVPIVANGVKVSG